jgi:RNA polymerase sigma-70 factor, ECF subfamily
MTTGAMATSADDNDDLLQRARCDSQALGQLYDLHYAGVLRYCIHRLFVREVAEDVTGQVFLVVAQRIRQFPGSAESDFANWLYAIASNQAAACIRDTQRRRQLFEAAARQGRIRVSDPAGSQDDLDWPHLYAAIASLPDRDQAIVTLRAFEGLSFEQVGAVLQMKPTAARVAFHRALDKLRVQLAGPFGHTQGE